MYLRVHLWALNSKPSGWWNGTLSMKPNWDLRIKPYKLATQIIRNPHILPFPHSYFPCPPLSPTISSHMIFPQIFQLVLYTCPHFRQVEAHYKLLRWNTSRVGAALRSLIQEARLHGRNGNKVNQTQFESFLSWSLFQLSSASSIFIVSWSYLRLLCLSSFESVNEVWAARSKMAGNQRAGAECTCHSQVGWSESSNLRSARPWKPWRLRKCQMFHSRPSCKTAFGVLFFVYRSQFKFSV